MNFTARRTQGHPGRLFLIVVRVTMLLLVTKANLNAGNSSAPAAEVLQTGDLIWPKKRLEPIYGEHPFVPHWVHRRIRGLP